MVRFWREVQNGATTMPSAGDATRPSGLKILIVGPSASGKSALANFLLGEQERDALQMPSTYNETKGVRILEYNRSLPGRGNNDVEIWDVSGNSEYESGWRAVMQHCDGVLLVYNPEQAGHPEQVGNWYDTFVKVNDLDPKSQCLVFAHHSQTGGGMTAAKPPPKFSQAGIAFVDTSYDSTSTTVIQQNFDDFLVRCLDQKNRRD